MSEEIVIICLPIEQDPLPGSSIEFCQICAEQVWLSVGGQALRRNEAKTKLLCTRCAVNDPSLPLEQVQALPDDREAKAWLDRHRPTVVEALRRFYGKRNP